jgi:ABC-type glycerol-3-phosphate transport system substrate-binding protein
MALSAVAWAIRPGSGGSHRTPLIWVSDDDPTRREHIAIFNRQNPDLDLQLDPDNGGPEKVIVQSLGGVGPDLFDCYFPDELAAYVQAGIAWDITDELAKRGINISRDCWPTLLPYVQLNGRIYGFPANAAVDVLYYDKSAFDSAGEPYPTGPVIWDRLIPVLQRMTQRDANGRIIRYGISIDDPYWMALVMQWGGRIYSADGTRCELDSSQAIAAIQFLHDLIYRYKVLPSPGDVDAMNAAGGWGTAGMQVFSSHRAATAIGGRWWLCTLRNMSGLNLGACEAPTGPAGPVYQGYGKSTIINRASPHREQALRFLIYMASRGYTQLINQQADGLGPIKLFCTDDTLVNPAFPQEATYQHVFRDVMPLGRAVQTSPFVNAALVARVVNDQLDLVRRDAKSPRDAMHAAAVQINAAIVDELSHDLDLKAQYHRLTGRDGP